MLLQNGFVMRFPMHEGFGQQTLDDDTCLRFPFVEFVLQAYLQRGVRKKGESLGRLDPGSPIANHRSLVE